MLRRAPLPVPPIQRSRFSLLDVEATHRLGVSPAPAKPSVVLMRLS